jgi:REP-associated tyrosine transposase
MIASHVTFGCYGFWLPNDPRGSWSEYVRNRRLLAFGHATKTDEIRSLAKAPHDHTQRQTAKQTLRHQPVRFNGVQARAVARGITRAVEESDYLLFALCTMPDHVHAVVAEHRNPPKQIVGHFKGRATQQLKHEKLYPPPGRSSPPSPWARGGWCVYLDDEEAVHQAIEYVNRNPVLAGLPPQHWSFVVPP